MAGHARKIAGSLILLTASILPVLAAAQGTRPEVHAGELVVEPATLMALGFEWYVEGDDNRNARVDVAYREAGSAAPWREALPLLRLGGEEIRQPPSFNVVTPNMFAGSIFDLKAGTAYEVRLRLQDPDGTGGESTRQVTVRTRAEPMRPEGGRTFHVYPPGYVGAKQEPAFSSLLEAYNTGANGADWSNSFVPRVQPGDVIVMHAGIYSQDRKVYGGRGMGTLFDGTMYLTAKGTAEKPIAIVAAGDGDVVIDGGGNHVLFNLQAADHHYFEGITVRNTDVAFDLGHKRIGGAVGFVLKNSRVENVGRGVSTDWGGARDFYIADNVFVGRNDPDRLMGWIGRTWNQLPGFPQPLLSEYAVKVFGSGHVIAHNFVAYFHDGIDHATYGDPDGWPNTPRDRMPVAIDIHNNDVRNVDDNCIEADGALYNIRILRNRCFNQAHRALSTQPVLGGPAYFIRNIVYNAPEGGALKLTANSAGVLIYNNTFLSEVHQMGPTSNVHFRNNIIIGQGAWPQVFSTEEFTPYSSSDHNAFGPTAGSVTPFAIVRASSAARSYAAPRTEELFIDLRAYSAATGRDRDSTVIDYSSFVRASAPDRRDPTRVYDPGNFDFGLVEQSPAVDAGVALPNVTDGFSGSAPDLGAFERGQSFHVGPRSR